MTNFKKNFQSFGKSLLFPISLLSFMAIFLGLAAALQNPNIIEFMPFLDNTFLQNILGMIRKISASIRVFTVIIRDVDSTWHGEA